MLSVLLLSSDYLCLNFLPFSFFLVGSVFLDNFAVSSWLSWADPSTLRAAWLRAFFLAFSYTELQAFVLFLQKLKIWLPISQVYVRWHSRIVECPTTYTTMVSAFVAETPNRKKNPFLPARKKHPYLLALANPHARITLGTRRYGFCVTSSWQYAFLIGPFVPHDLYTRFWLVHAILALYYYYYQVWIYT